MIIVPEYQIGDEVKLAYNALPIRALTDLPRASSPIEVTYVERGTLGEIVDIYKSEEMMPVYRVRCRLKGSSQSTDVIVMQSMIFISQKRVPLPDDIVAKFKLDVAQVGTCDLSNRSDLIRIVTRAGDRLDIPPLVLVDDLRNAQRRIVGTRPVGTWTDEESEVINLLSDMIRRGAQLAFFYTQLPYTDEFDT